jgi:hypothetical protein
MELQMQGSGVQAATAPKFATLFCALHSRVVEFHVFYYVMNFVAVR